MRALCGHAIADDCHAAVVRHAAVLCERLQYGGFARYFAVTIKDVSPFFAKVFPSDDRMASRGGLV